MKNICVQSSVCSAFSVVVFPEKIIDSVPYNTVQRVENNEQSL